METRFIELFKETLEIEADTVHLDTVFRELEQWDSLAFLSVIAMIDEEYDVVIEGNDFKKLVTISELIEEIKKRKA
ncbi:MAG: acyl carrier protein [Bacteroidales bacterium]|nr:acyl carrier protein [Bacteroidales bacterium]